MGGFKRALLGYRRADVDAAFAQTGARISELERQLPRIGELQRELDARDVELGELSGMVIERERDNRELREELRAAQERHDRSLASLESLTDRLEEVQAQARGQATRIRMKALREAVEVSRRVQELAGRISPDSAGGDGKSNGRAAGNGVPVAVVGNGGPAELQPSTAPEYFDGEVRVDIGPLADFSQLVGFEDAAGQIRELSGISVESFSAGRATLALRLDDPVDLLRELEARCPIGFAVRHTASDRVVLDVDEAGASERHAA